jgi:hypothetical protein
VRRREVMLILVVSTMGSVEARVDSVEGGTNLLDDNKREDSTETFHARFDPEAS